MDKPKRSETLKTLLPEVLALMRPRRGLLLIGAALMIINRVCGLALPFSTKYLVDNVMLKGEFKLLMPIVLAVVGATIIQGVTSYSLTQLLSKAGQRLIAELRAAVQEHIGRLPVRLLRCQQNRRAGVAHHDRRGRRAQSGRHRPGRFRRRHADRRFRPGRPASHQRRHDRRRARRSYWRSAWSCKEPSTRFGRFFASAARSTPKSPAGSPNRWAACAW